MILRELNPQDEAAFRKCIAAWDNSPDFNFAFGLVEGLKFESYLQILKEMKEGINLAPGFVPATALFGFVGNDIVGKVSIRHELNDHLLKVGGNIGYGVLPEFRGNGYASEMLKQSLEYCRKLGLTKALVTCDENNVASAKVIEKNGGIFENLYEPQDGSSKKKRYWIKL